MDQLIVSLVLAAIDGVPKIIEAITLSQTLTADEKKKLVADLRSRLIAANAKVAAVQFREVAEDLASPAQP